MPTTHSKITSRAGPFARGLAAVLGAVAAMVATAHEVHPLGFTELAWRAPQVARVTASLLDFHSGALVLSWTGLGRTEQIDGRACLVGPYFLIDVDDDWAFDVDESVEVEIDLARGRGVLLSYDHASSAPVAARLSNGTGGRTVRTSLHRARFANRLFANSDLAIAAPGAVYPYDADAEHEIAICDLRLRRGTAAPRPEGRGHVRLSVVDAATGQPTAARVGLFDASGRLPLPSARAVPIRRYAERVRQIPIITGRELWPAPGGYAFYVDGGYAAELPPGEYTLIVMKGPEYRVHRQTLEVGAQATTSMQVRLERWTDAPAAGWYSGDVHVHITRAVADNPEVLAQMRAEDLHVTNVLQMANVVRHHFPQYAFGAEGRYRLGEHLLASGQEAPRSGHRGHTIGLNGTRYHDPSRFFLYHEVAEALHADGGLYGYAHVMQGAFHVARGLALDAPLGLVDFVEILQFGTVSTELYYDMLNLGLRMAPAGGSDYPYIDLPGAARNYVHIDGEFTPEAWFEGLRRGRAFVSNGPMLEFGVNGTGMGEELLVPAGVAVDVRARARLNPDLDRLRRLELVQDGTVIAHVEAGSGAEELQLDHRFVPRHGTWLAVRAYGQGVAVAHSAPIYVRPEGARTTYEPKRAIGLAEKYLGIIDQALGAELEPREDLEHWETGAQLRARWQEQLPALREHAARARARLTAIRDAAAADAPVGVR